MRIGPELPATIVFKAGGGFAEALEPAAAQGTFLAHAGFMFLAHHAER